MPGIICVLEVSSEGERGMSRPDVAFFRKMTLNVVDWSNPDAVMWAARISAPHLKIYSVRHMVDLLIQLCNGGLWTTYVDQLCIVGHGNQTGQYIGADWVDFSSLGTHSKNLKRLRPHFCAGAVVTLEGCEVGNASSLMKGLSNLFDGVPVRAGTAFQRPLIPGLEGGVRTCVPDRCSYTGRRPFDVLDDALLR